MAAAPADAPVPLLDAVPLAATSGGRAELGKRLTSGGTSLGAPLGSHSPSKGFRALGSGEGAQGAGSRGVTHAGNRSDPV